MSDNRCEAADLIGVEETFPRSCAMIDIDHRSDSARSYAKGPGDDSRSVASTSLLEGGLYNVHSRSGHAVSTSGGLSHLPPAGPSGHSVANSSRGMNVGGELWSLELKDLDESIESSLVDPPTSGSLYTRLLVRAVGVLHCEVTMCSCCTVVGRVA